MALFCGDWPLRVVEPKGSELVASSSASLDPGESEAIVAQTAGTRLI